MTLQLDAIKDPDILRQVAQLALRDNDRLYQRLAKQAEELAALKGTRAAEQLEIEMRLLKEQADALRRKLYGASSERRARDKETRPPEPPSPPTAPREQRQLPLETVIWDLPAEARVCACCDNPMVQWEGQQEEVVEVDLLPRRFVLKKHVRRKYRCPCGSAPVLAPGPLRLPGGGRYSVDFAIEVAVNKWSDHAPLERQVRVMRREGLDINSSTLWEQVERLCRVLGATYDALRQYVVAAQLVHADETPWYLLKQGRKKHWVWSIGREDAVYFRVDPSRGHQVILEMLGGFEGCLVVDGYQAYATAQRACGRDVEIAICWSHARRKLDEAEQSYPEASEALDLIGEMFLIERDLPDWQAIRDPALRAKALAQIHETRQTKTRPLIDALEAWTRSQRVLPKSRLGLALAYLHTYRAGLHRFLDDARVPMSNNAAERSLRGCVVGRKNFYGSKSVRGTEVASIFYSLLESAKLARVEPKAYLREAVQSALKGEPPLLPQQYRQRLLGRCGGPSGGDGWGSARHRQPTVRGDNKDRAARTLNPQPGPS